MKRFVILLVIALSFAGMSAFAVESVLIDFSELAAEDNGENSATTIDFSKEAGTSFTDEEKAVMNTSLALNNWEVVLSSSSRTVTQQRNSYTREVTVKDSAKQFAGENVLGVRIQFPKEPFNSWALIKPPFNIPAFADEEYGIPDFTEKGVIKNVGVIKSISMTLYGSNFPNGLGIVLRNENNEENQIFLGNMDFDGWKTITWNNPNYINEVRNRELKKYPLYPVASPHIVFGGILVYKDAAQMGGDFVTYIKDIKVVYDQAVLELERDIDDEGVWGILSEREKARRLAEFNRLGNIQVLRYLEQKRMHSDNQE